MRDATVQVIQQRSKVLHLHIDGSNNYFDILLRIGSCCTDLSEQPNHGAGKCFVLSCGCKMLRLLYRSLPLIKAMMRDSLSDISHQFEVCRFVNREEDYEGYNEEGDGHAWMVDISYFQSLVVVFTQLQWQ